MMRKDSGRAGRVVGAGFVAMGLMALSGCQKAAPPGEPPPPTVGVVESRQMSVPILVTPNGTTRSLENVTIRARVRGFLSERHFTEGSFVKKGQLLLVIEEEPYKVALQSALAKQAEARAMFKKAEESKGREIATAQLELSRAQLVLAQIQEHRSRTLVARNAGSNEEVDKTEAEHRKWEAQVVADVANLEQAKADYEIGLAASTAQVEAAKAAVRDAELNLGYCRMFAPIDGRIGEARVKVGNLVGPDAGGGGAFSELAMIQQLDPMGVNIRLSSRDLDRLRPLVDKGLAVKLTRLGPSGVIEHPHEGKCDFIDNFVDETTSTFLARASMPNPSGTLLPGEYVKMKMALGKLDEAVVVPSPAVSETETGQVVYVVDAQGKVAVLQVEAAQTFEGLRVVTKGLKPGVPVIVEGLQVVRPGQAVKTEKATLPQQAAKLKPSAPEVASGPEAARAE